MRRHFASANPTRLRRVQAGGGHAAFAWLMGWRREARHPRRWRLIAHAIAWARVAPALGTGPLWGSGLADATAALVSLGYSRSEARQQHERRESRRGTRPAAGTPRSSADEPVRCSHRAIV